MTAARELLGQGDLKAAADSARRAFAAARSQRSHQLISEAWITLLETLAADPENDLTIEYREHVEGAFSWAETMPEEIQVWFLIALEPHLEALGFRRLVDRSQALRAKAQKWLQRSLNVSARLQTFQLADLEAGNPVDRRCLALERSAAFYADELFDPQAMMLDDAALAWERAGRPDRAAFVAALAEEIRTNR
ncbi:MAG TPA: hypothetical protein VMP41_03255 [Acidimicrobiales bacterium]|nr:hypothetical protein [Acidimicrobiales bacterium]